MQAFVREEAPVAEAWQPVDAYSSAESDSGSDGEPESCSLPGAESRSRVDAAFAIGVTVLLVAAMKIAVQLIAGPLYGAHTPGTQYVSHSVT